MSDAARSSGAAGTGTGTGPGPRVAGGGATARRRGAPARRGPRLVLAARELPLGSNFCWYGALAFVCESAFRDGRDTPGNRVERVMRGAVRRAGARMVDVLPVDRHGERLLVFLCAVDAASPVLEVAGENGAPCMVPLFDDARRETQRVVNEVREAVRGELAAGEPRAILVRCVDEMALGPSREWGAELRPDPDRGGAGDEDRPGDDAAGGDRSGDDAASEDRSGDEGASEDRSGDEGASDDERGGGGGGGGGGAREDWGALA